MRPETMLPIGRACALLLMGWACAVGALGCSDACEDAQDACEECGKESAACEAEVATCETYAEDGTPSRESCCEALLESFEPCP
jgi:hypothetical protein